jgi:hypothetical protein
LRKIMYDADSDLFHLVAQVISFRSCIKDCAEGADYYANLEYEMRKRLSGKRMPDESGIPATPND